MGDGVRGPLGHVDRHRRQVAGADHRVDVVEPRSDGAAQFGDRVERVVNVADDQRAQCGAAAAARGLCSGDEEEEK